jgi:rhodanese-related sulfurtransferase
MVRMRKMDGAWSPDGGLNSRPILGYYTPGRRRFMKTPLCLLLFAAVIGAASCASEPAASYRSPDALAALVAEKTEPYVLVDVRTPEEYSTGHIPTAVNFPVSTIAKSLPTEDRGALIIVYCASGRRSSTAKTVLDGLGFTRVVDFGSISRWEGELASGDSPEGSGPESSESSGD